MKPSIFIGSSKEGLKIAEQVQYDLRHISEGKVWSQGVFGLSKGNIENLMAEVDKRDFAILILTPDDMVTSRDVIKPAPRDNVLFELGLFMGRLGPKRSFVLFDNSPDLGLKILSDLAGITLADYDGGWANRDKDAAIGAACKPIRDVIEREGFFIPSDDIVAYGNKVGLLTFDHCYVQTDMNDTEYKLQVVNRDQVGAWETFELIDPDNTALKPLKKPLRFGDKIGLKGYNKQYIGANLNPDREALLYAWESEYIGKEWGKFKVQPLSSKTGIKEGDFVRYGNPVALVAHNLKLVAYRCETDKYLWAASDFVGTWEQFTFVHGTSIIS